MSIKVSCLNGHSLKIKSKYAGKLGLCPICKARVEMPFSDTIRIGGEAITTTATRQKFLDLLQKSRLLSAGQFEEARAAAKDGQGAKAIARKLARAGLLTDWQGAQLVAGHSSFFLGNYKLIQLLGRGGMGGVFLGEHLTMHRRVAVKIASRKIARNPESVRRFLAEARAIAALDHPNIVRAYSVDNEGDRYYLVMEFVDGRNLKQIVRTQGPLEPRLAADYIRQAAEGLQHGHQRNVIHCDIKPSNLLVSREGVVKIVDMGLSLLQAPNRKDAHRHGDDRVLGTVNYLAPEQVLGRTDVDHRVDIYSLGCTLYFLLTGRAPFPEGALHERLLRHVSAEPESIDSFRSDVPEELIDVCKKMMAKDPAERYSTAREVAEALGKIAFPLHKTKSVAAAV
jgi:serine/threonine-protein kinase